MSANTIFSEPDSLRLPPDMAERSGKRSASEVASKINPHIEAIARTLLGSPNESLSSSDELRFGSKGSLSVKLTGLKAGKWYDHESGIGGDAIKLIQHCNHCSFDEACDWFETNIGLAESATLSCDESVDKKEVTKKAKVKEIIDESIDVQGTPGELYLKSRGITTEMPDCIRFRYNAWEPYGALVAIATDAEGTCLAVQQIYITNDGKKAPLKVKKRTNKARDGWSKEATVRLPGKQPLVIAEGVETALSIWQATGQETWATLGVANFRHAPVPAGADVIIASDGNAADSKAADQTRKAGIALKEQGVKVLVAEPPQGQDFNDVLVQQGDEVVRQMLSVAKPLDELLSTAKTLEDNGSSWIDGLLKYESGQPRAELANVIHALRHAPEWHNVLWYDEFGLRTVAREAPPWADHNKEWKEIEWDDYFDCLTTEWMQRQGIMAKVQVVGQAVETVSREHCFHPVRKYLENLQWDGRPRLDQWLVDYLGAENTPFVKAVGPRFMISAVARIFRPGCQVDSALIFEGSQGTRKSTALRVLAEPWFTDRISDLGSKDSAIETCGVWLIEFSELDTMGRSAASEIKAFLTRRTDRYRPPYGKRLVNVPRQCVFAGTINPEGGYLKDPTGARRFWPVKCGTIDVEALARDRDQLWAEAFERFKKEEPWWLESQELEHIAGEEQAARYYSDPWEEPIRTWLENSGRKIPRCDVSVGEVLKGALSVGTERWAQADQNRVVRCLVAIGFVKTRVSRNGRREYRYLRDEKQFRSGLSGLFEK